ncbi:peptidoglycan DD-metalloendopeptidase family protein [Microbacterium sp.]|uniref:peptidoglycan DD-metalloendopeptidase family protein n=1 Tax=Microbacterium sp. TaxID=51671 RepID=UPI0039E420BD
MTSHTVLRTAALLAATLLLVSAPAVPVAAAWTGSIAPSASSAEDRRSGWRWPVDAVVLTRPYEAPAHRYGPGHRGVDLAVPPGGAALAPAAGVVAFSGTVVDRGVVTIDHGDGFVTTLEPVTGAPPVGTAVAAGDLVGVVSVGGHTAAGSLHFGVREHGEYINPMLLLGGIPRAVLLPCC